MGVALDSGRDLDKDAVHQGSVAQDVPIDSTLPGRWFRLTIRGLPEDGFAVEDDQFYLKADFFGDHGKRAARRRHTEDLPPDRTGTPGSGRERRPQEGRRGDLEDLRVRVCLAVSGH